MTRLGLTAPALADAQHNLAARVAALAELVAASCLGEGQDGFDDRLEFSGIDQFGDLGQLRGVGLGGHGRMADTVPGRDFRRRRRDE